MSKSKQNKLKSSSRKIQLTNILKTNSAYVGIHGTTFKDFLLKDELLRAIKESGFEHPSQGSLTIKQI